MENIAFQKTATQSSTYNDTGGRYCAAHAVDGNTATNFSPGSCSHTNEADTSVVKASWQVLLDDHQMFNISLIRIYLRSDAEDHDKNMTVLVNGGVCYSVNGATLEGKVRSGSNPVDVTCTHVMRGNNVTITMSGRFLALCEVQVFVCSDGWYGSDCDKQCQCLNTSEVCDKNTGYCKSGCAAGKQGQGCQQDCEDGYYGGNCSQKCGSCKDGTHCNKSNGECSQECKTNFQAPYCKVCKDGLFGTACSKHCKCRNRTEICDKVTGNCRSGCPAGLRGSGCQEECADYTYGINCSGVCSCLNQCEMCEKVTGECQTGYHTTTAEKSTASPLKNKNIGHKTDIRFIVVCCLMVVLGVYSAAATTLIFRLKRKNAKTQAELEKQYMTLGTRGESSVYEVIAGTHTYSNDVQPENSHYENTTRRVMKRDEHSL